MSALWIAAGVALWTLHFAVMYATVTWACAHGEPDWATGGVIGVSIAAIAGAGALIVHGYRRRATFNGWMSAGVAALAGVAIVYEVLGAVFLPVCR